MNVKYVRLLSRGWVKLNCVPDVILKNTTEKKSSPNYRRGLSLALDVNIDFG